MKKNMKVYEALFLGIVVLLLEALVFSVVLK